MDIEGRIDLDVFQVIQRDFKLRSYSLNKVSVHFLKEPKENVHHSTLSDVFEGNNVTRKRLAVDCFKVRRSFGDRKSVSCDYESD